MPVPDGPAEGEGLTVARSYFDNRPRTYGPCKYAPDCRGQCDDEETRTCHQCRTDQSIANLEDQHEERRRGQ